MMGMVPGPQLCWAWGPYLCYGGYGAHTCGMVVSVHTSELWCPRCQYMCKGVYGAHTCAMEGKVPMPFLWRARLLYLS